ncbi:universal stress protein [Virgibacillus sp. C22-A2]|uniref:Universal stress protein n=1 Tax=Virgibacillus tibetensis TaxID=3042313 RepID=A0ABU6KKK4_9BACI|nr:universal stress protein [Virgibacillus sp. C22-A2]
MFNRILLAADGSEHSVRSARYAIDLAEKYNAAVVAVYVVDRQKAKSDVLHATNKFEIEKKRKEKIKSVTSLLKESKIDYKVQVLHGEAGPTVVRYANDNHFDCVVIGSRGLNNLQTFILGSVSHKVAKRVECPVLIVK